MKRCGVMGKELDKIETTKEIRCIIVPAVGEQAAIGSEYCFSPSCTTST